MPVNTIRTLTISVDKRYNSFDLYRRTACIADSLDMSFLSNTVHAESSKIQYVTIKSTYSVCLKILISLFRAVFNLQ
jgi:hypothetical protein